MAARFRSNVCQGYGTVVDVYIPNRKSKAGKRFAFVRFIKVENVDRLVGKLCTLWIGRMHLHANVVRFERSPIHSSRPTNPIRSDNTGAPSFASALKGNHNISLPISSSPAMVLDDSCVVKCDLDNYVMGEVKQFSSINNLHETQSSEEHLSFEIHVNGHEQKKAVISWRSSRCFPMNCLSLNIQGLGSKAKKEWIRELNIKHKVNFLTLQETKMDSISAMDVKLLWGNYNFDHVFSEAVGNSGGILCNYNFNHIFSEAVGNSGGILCMWDSNVFHKEKHIISDNFVALYGTWNPNKAKLLMISIYAPQSATGKRSLWSYITSLITRWNGDCMVMGDFNEVRCMEDRMGLFITWSHSSATKMSKLNRFLVTEDQGGVNDEILLSRMDLLKQIHDIKSSDARDCMQKAKIQWAIEGDENSKFFHGIINRKRVNLAIKGVMVDGEWMDDPSRVKEEFCSHFATRFQAPGVNRSRLNFRFPNRLNPDQVAELENPITRDEIRNAVWACGENRISHKGKFGPQDLRPQFHSVLIKSDIELDPFLCCGLIDIYSKCGEINDATRVYDMMLEKELVALIALLCGYSQSNNDIRALSLFAEKHRDEIGVNETTLQAIYVTEQGTLVFDESPVADLATFTSLISAYAQTGQGEEAIKLYLKMLDLELKPDSFICNSLINTAASLSDYEQETSNGSTISETDRVLVAIIGKAFTSIPVDPKMAKISIFASYLEAQAAADKAYVDRDKWHEISILRTAGSCRFSSDRTIEDYAEQT
nr:RNA-directed DNA polymerase, eukaryota [Tanacetum cinerariifolium]